MGFQARHLLRERAVIVMQVEAGLADGDQFGVVAGHRQQGVGGNIGPVLGMVRVCTERAPYILMRLGNGLYRIKLAQPAADGDDGRDAGLPRAVQHSVQIVRVGVAVQVGVGINEHGQNSCRRQAADGRAASSRSEKAARRLWRGSR